MNGVIEKSLNKGVPIDTPIVLLYNDLSNLFKNKEKFKKIIDKEFEKYINFIYEGLPFRNDIELFLTMSVVTDSETLEKKVIFAPSGLVSSLAMNLNLDNMCNGFKRDEFNEGFGNLADIKVKFAPKFEDRIQRLESLISPRQLKKEFPFLYEKFEMYENYYNSLKVVEKALTDEKIPLLDRLKNRKLFIDSYRKNGDNIDIDELFLKSKKFNLNTFCKEYASVFRVILSKFDDIIDYMYSNPIDFSSINQIDKDSLELYIANQFMFLAESGGVVDKQRFIYYVSNYFYENKDLIDSDTPRLECGKVENKNIKFKDRSEREGYEVTPKLLYKRYRNLLVNNPEIKVIDFSKTNFEGMDLASAEEYVSKLLKDLTANWDFLPADDESLDREVISNIKRGSRYLSDAEREAHQQKLLELYMEKKEFYAATNPFFRIKGKNTFDGYVGYIYHNGKVVLEKFYENSKIGKLADGEAIYIMDMDEFYTLSQHSKKELMNNKLCKRIIHRGDWKGRVSKVINNNNNSIDPINDIKKLVKDNKVTGYND